MPYLIPAVKAWAAATAFTVSGVAVTYGTLVTVATVAASIAYSSIENSRLRNSLKGLGADRGRDIMSRDPLAYRRLIYGEILTTGPILYMATEGAKNENLHMVIALAGHECDSFGNFVVLNDGEQVAIDGAGDAAGKYNGYLKVKKFLGTTTQAASAELMAAFPGVWTSNHNLFGIAYAHVVLKYSADIYPDGIPTVKFLVRGKKVWDPRINPSDTSIRSWSCNPSLCAADFLNDSQFGRGVAWSRIRTSAIIEAANICDEGRTLAGGFVRQVDTFSGSRNINMTTQASSELDGLVVGMKINATGVPAGARITYIDAVGPVFYISIDADCVSTGTNRTANIGNVENLYEAHGTITSDQLVDEALTSILSSMAGHVTDAGGIWTIRAGAYRTPTVSLDESHMIGPITMTPRVSRRENYNGVKGTYISPFNQWTASDFPAIKNDTYMAWDGGVRLWKDISLPFTISPTAAQRLAKIDLERGRQQIQVEQTFKLHAFECMCFDVVRITKTELGWTNKLFEVTDWTLIPIVEGENIAVGVKLGLRETAAEVWDFAEGTETTVDLAQNTNLPSPSIVPVPSSLSLLADDTTAFVQSDGTFVPRLQVTWPLPGNIYIEQGGRTEVEYKVHGSATWIPWSTPSANFLVDYITDIKAGDYIDVRIRYRNQLGVRGAYRDSLGSYPSGYLIPAKAALPTGVSSLAAAALPEAIRLTWAVPNITGIEAIEIYELGAATPAPSAGTSPTFVTGANATSYDRTGLTAGAAPYYWVRVRDTSKNKSTWSGPVTATAANGVTYAIASASGKNTNFYTDTTPTAIRTGDTWFKPSTAEIFNWNGSSWVLISLKHDAILGQLTDSQIAAIAAAKVTGTLSDSQLAAIDATKILNQIVGTQIADGSIITPKLAANAVTTNELAANAVTAAKILAGEVTTSKLAAGAVTTNELAAGAVVAGKIAAGEVTATHIGANQIITNAANIANAVITSAKIASLDAGKISAGAIAAAISLSSTGSFSSGSGGNYFEVDVNGVIFGNPAGYHMQFKDDGSGIVNFYLKNGGTTLSQWIMGGGLHVLDMGNLGSIQNVVNVDITAGLDVGGTINGNGANSNFNTVNATNINGTGALVMSGNLSGAGLNVGGGSITGGLAYLDGVRYPGSANKISFYWDGSNVRAEVDGFLNGTIPNP